MPLAGRRAKEYLGLFFSRSVPVSQRCPVSRLLPLVTAVAADFDDSERTEQPASVAVDCSCTVDGFALVVVLVGEWGNVVGSEQMAADWK